MKCDIKIYGIEERKENILHNKEILGLSDGDVFIAKREDRITPQDKWPYKACKKAFTQPVPSGVTHRLVLQDDVELAPNFLEYLDKMVNAQPNAIIMLTALDFKTQNDYADNLKTPYVQVGVFVSGCAVIIPVKHIKPMFKWFEKTYPQIWIGNPHEDAAFKFYAMTFKIPCITSIPSLVQHLGDQSTVCNYEQPLRTAYFENWDKANWDSQEIADAYFNKEEIDEYMKKEKEMSKDDSVHYFVRTTGERFFDYSPLKTICLYDYKHEPVNSFIEQLEKISKYNSVLMEDDLILCKNFKEEIEKAIARFPNSIIQFFTDPDVYESTYLRSFPFEWNQCTYYPKGIGKVIATAMRQILNRFPKDQKLYSQVESTALYLLAIPHIVYRPCLVQHNDLKSILQDPDHRRDTIWFKDYLDEAGVRYEQAYTRETVKKLTEIRNKHVEEILEKEKNK